MKLNLSRLRPLTDPQPMILRDPGTGEPITRDGKPKSPPVVIYILGPDSPKMLVFEAAIASSRLKWMQRNSKHELTTEQLAVEVRDRVSACVTGWDNIADDGADVLFSQEALDEIASEFRHFRDQVDAFYRNDGNFLKADSGENSKPRSK